MIFARNIFLFLAILVLTSCAITDQVRVVQVEVMKPGVFIFPEDFNRVAIFNRDLFQSDTCLFSYYDDNTIKVDTTISYKSLSNHCVDALTGFLKEEKYFAEVKNYKDSLNYFWRKDSVLHSSEELLNKTQADIFIFLDFLTFNNTMISRSIDYVSTTPYLVWNIGLKNDTASYIYNQIDTLVYEGDEFNSFNSRRGRHRSILENASEYLGKSLGLKLIPNWISVERMYYKSSNPDMLKAEKYALQNEWMKAAEIWNRETKNKNPKIVAKACFNMAVAAEMEGKHDVSIDWLVKSYSALPANNSEHKANCQRYINVLAIRKKEIERLGKQIREE
ncbi:MAG: hypothetical protein K0M50_04070 [Prolixibacteraceae bacterium]|nr:hypothetical protein [Prolixibacteraceae bacterium]